MRRHLAGLGLMCCVLGAGVVPAPSAAQVSAADPCVQRLIVQAGAFDTRVCGMPDFDQRRKEGQLAGDGREFGLVGLLGDGGCHCVPTSITDLLGYYANRGIEVEPGAFPFATRPAFADAPDDDGSTYLAFQPYPTDEVFAYNRITNLIHFLGGSVEVGNGKCGTSYGAAFASFEQLIESGTLPDDRFVYTNSGTDAGTPYTLSATMANGGVASVAYGRYSNYAETDGEFTFVNRGGHVVAVTGVAGQISTNATLRYHDPNSGGDEDKWRQSPYAEVERQLTRVTRKKDGEVMWRIGAVVAAGETQPVVDSYATLHPTLLVSIFKRQFRFVAAVDVDPTDDRPPVWEHRVDDVIRDAAVMGPGEVAYIAKGSRRVRAIVPATGAQRDLGPAPAGARDIETDPTGRHVYVLGRRSLVTLDRQGGVSERTRLRGAPSALAYDWTPGKPWRERLAVIAAGARTLRTFNPDTLEPTGRTVLRRGLLSGAGRLTAAFAPGGTLQLRRGDGSVRTRSGVDRLADTNPGFATTDGGTLLALRGGRVIAPGSAAAPFVGTRLRGRIVAVSHSGADVGRAQARRLINPTPMNNPDLVSEPAPTPPAAPAPTPTPSASPAPTAAPTATATAVPPAAPNLVVSAASATSITVANTGTAAAGPFTVSVSRRGATPLQLGVRDLAAGASTTRSIACLSQVRTVTADSFDAVVESDEGDNTRQFTSVCP